MDKAKLDELARLQAAAMAEKTTLAICDYRRALLRAGDALLEYVRQLEGERDSYRKQCSDLLNGIALAGAEGDARLKREGAAEWLENAAREGGYYERSSESMLEEAKQLREGK